MIVRAAQPQQRSAESTERERVRAVLPHVTHSSFPLFFSKPRSDSVKILCSLFGVTDDPVWLQALCVYSQGQQQHSTVLHVTRYSITCLWSQVILFDPKHSMLIFQGLQLHCCRWQVDQYDPRAQCFNSLCIWCMVNQFDPKVQICVSLCKLHIITVHPVRPEAH